MNVITKGERKKLLSSVCGFCGQKEEKHHSHSLQSIKLILRINACSNIPLMKSKQEKYGYLVFYCQ
jgi:hypothetical protein